MGIISEIIGIAGTGAFGGVFGFGASIIKRHFAAKEAKAKFERDMKLREYARADADAARTHEIKLHELNQAAEERETERELRIIDMKGAHASRKASQNDQRALSINPKGSQWTIDTLRMVRPLLTLLYFLLVLLIWFTTPDETLREFLAKQVVFLAAMSATWWFGERPQNFKNIGTV